VEKVVNAIIDEIEAALVRRDRVELRGFGTFTVKTRSARPWVRGRLLPSSSRIIMATLGARFRGCVLALTGEYAEAINSFNTPAVTCAR
jgi:hypothetical protein